MLIGRQHMMLLFKPDHYMVLTVTLAGVCDLGGFFVVLCFFLSPG